MTKASPDCGNLGASKDRLPRDSKETKVCGVRISCNNSIARHIYERLHTFIYLRATQDVEYSRVPNVLSFVTQRHPTLRGELIGMHSV